MNGISCVISVYNRTCTERFEKSFLSIKNQTLRANEIIIVKDGLINEDFDGYLKELSKVHSEVKIIGYDKNLGPGFARNYGIRNSSFNLIAIMDSDDISNSNRFEIQFEQFINDPDLILCGGTIKESNTNKIRVVPFSYNEIVEYSKIKSPFNNVTVMFKKEEYFLSGGYPFKRTSEDYQLWVKFIYLGYKLINVNDILVDVGFDDGAIARRAGLKILKDDIETQYLLFNTNQINLFRFTVNVMQYSFFRLSPAFLKKILINTFLRK